jgi:hypothetical protein
VNQFFCEVAYQPELWTILNLNHLANRINDQSLFALLSNQRFVHLQTLSLEGCAGVTNKSIKLIMNNCINLNKLLLTDCYNIKNPYLFVELIQKLSKLSYLELYGVTNQYNLVPILQRYCPSLNLGFFYYLYCAEFGIELCPARSPATCRYEGRMNERGCWGTIKGRIVYANDFYERAGNYPRKCSHTHINTQINLLAMAMEPAAGTLV